MPLRDFPLSRICMINGSRSIARARARRFRPSLPRRRAASRCNVGAFLFPPQTTPRAFDATIAAFTRSDISLASYSAMAAKIWIVRRLACGKSAATNSTPHSMSCAINATLRANRSSFAMTSVALNTRQSLNASLNCGRAAFVPLSTSVNSANNSPETDCRYRSTAALWASSPSPDFRGAVTLTPLDEAAMITLHRDAQIHRGLVADFLGDPHRSARIGLPAYSIGGGPGYLWGAKYNDAGRGTLQLSAVDASALGLIQSTPAAEFATKYANSFH